MEDEYLTTEEWDMLAPYLYKTLRLCAKAHTHTYEPANLSKLEQELIMSPSDSTKDLPNNMSDTKY